MRNVASGVNEYLPKILHAVNWIGSKFGLNIGDREGSALANDRERALESLATDALFRRNVEEQATAVGAFASVPEDVRKRALDEEVQKVIQSLREDNEFLSSIVGKGAMTTKGVDTRVPVSGSLAIPSLGGASYVWTQRDVGERLSASEVNERAITSARTSYVNQNLTARYVVPTPVAGTNANAVYDISRSLLGSQIADYYTQRSKAGAFDNSLTDAGGSDLTGVNNDRRSLEIHFHSALSEVTNYVQTGSPQAAAEARRNK
jgi:hypothetical protein